MVGTDLHWALVGGGAAGVAGLAVVLAAGEWGDRTPRLEGRYLLVFVGGVVAGSFVTFGVPVAAFLRYGLVAPLAVLAADVLFWTALASGDAPGRFFAVVLWPVVLLAYAAAAAVELLLRGSLALPAVG